MRRSCSYCGRVHERNVTCNRAPVRGRKTERSQADRFRSTSAWSRCRERVLERDLYLCRCCVDGRFGCRGVPGLERLLSVHHIEPLEERFDLRLDEENLITVCRYHHEEAEKGAIPKSYLMELARTSVRFTTRPGDKG